MLKVASVCAGVFGFVSSASAQALGVVTAWGENGSGQCDIPVAAQSGVTNIEGGTFHTIALKVPCYCDFDGSNEVDLGDLSLVVLIFEFCQ